VRVAFRVVPLGGAGSTALYLRRSTVGIGNNKERGQVLRGGTGGKPSRGAKKRGTRGGLQKERRGWVGGEQVLGNSRGKRVFLAMCLRAEKKSWNSVRDILDL